MRGIKGYEKVNLYDQDSGKRLLVTSLKKQWRKYSYPLTHRVKIFFITGDGGVLVKSGLKYSIEFVNLPNNWKCGTINPNVRCGQLQRGALYWRGNYIISGKGTHETSYSHFRY